MSKNSRILSANSCSSSVTSFTPIAVNLCNLNSSIALLRQKQQTAKQQTAKSKISWPRLASLGARFKSFLNHPTGPKTTHFWGPVANWGFVAAVCIQSKIISFILLILL